MAVRKESLHILLKTLSPIAPHLCHHLWQELGHKTAIVNEPWPSVDENALVRCLRSISSVIFLSVWWVFKRTSVWMSLRLLKEPTGLFAWSFIKPLTKR
jgi:isoleucyl-tRNA synthetase